MDLRLLLIAVVIAFSTILYYIYKLKVSPQFEYAGLTFRKPSLSSYLIIVGVTCLTAATLPQRIRRVADFMLWIVFIIAAAPSILLAQYSQTLTQYESTKMGICIATCMILASVLVSKGPTFSLPIKSGTDGVGFWIAIGAFSIAFYIYMFITTGIHLRLLSFSDVYDVRADYGTASSGDRILGYMLPVQANVINPIVLARGIYSRKYVILAAGIFAQLVVYSSTGQKSVLFSIIACIGIAFLFRIQRRPRASLLFIAVTLTSGFALVVDRLTGSILWTSLLVRRLIVVPGSLTAAYVSVFMHQPRMGFVDVVPYAQNPYSEVRPASIVGSVFVGNSQTSANVNLFGHGYLEFGYLGMFIEMAVLIALLLFANSATRHLPTPVSVIIFFAPAMSLAGASVFTTALTHGFIAAVILCAFAPRVGWGRKKTVAE